MRMDTANTGGKACPLCADDHPQALLIKLLGRHEQAAFAHEADMIRQSATMPIAMAAVPITDWQMELTPWHDDAVSRDIEADGRGARATLDFITGNLIPYLHNRFGILPAVIGGYSLGGLFALWAASESGAFSAVAAASPSVWITGWLEYATTHPVRAKAVYLSLGDREEHVRNQSFARVGTNIRAEHELLLSQLGPARCTLEWNPGNHFMDNDRRTARAFAWCVSRVAQEAASWA